MEKRITGNTGNGVTLEEVQEVMGMIGEFEDFGDYEYANVFRKSLTNLIIYATAPSDIAELVVDKDDLKYAPNMESLLVSIRDEVRNVRRHMGNTGNGVTAEEVQEVAESVDITEDMLNGVYCKECLTTIGEATGEARLCPSCKDGYKASEPEAPLTYPKKDNPHQCIVPLCFREKEEGSEFCNICMYFK